MRGQTFRDFVLEFTRIRYRADATVISESQSFGPKPARVSVFVIAVRNKAP